MYTGTHQMAELSERVVVTVTPRETHPNPSAWVRPVAGMFAKGNTARAPGTNNTAKSPYAWLSVVVESGRLRR